MDKPAETKLKPYPWTKETISFYYETALKSLNRKSFTTAQEFIDLFTEACAAEKNFDEAFVHFLTWLREQGMEIETDQGQIRTFAEKLYNLRLKRILINAAGLNLYEDQIISNEINRLYPAVTPPPPPPPRRKKG